MAANNNDGDANGSPPFEFPGFAEGALWRGDSNLEELIESRDPVSDWTARVGRTQLVDKDANVDVQSIAEAVRNNNHPERLSAFVKPADFDQDKFLADPQAYLDVVEPGRVFQSAEYAEGVENIFRTNGFFHQLLQGESVLLSTRSEPMMPVTFYSNRLGRFQNQLTSISVQADEQGHAEARFFATPGTFGDLDIIASSPLNSDQASWLIRVRLPERNFDESADVGERP